MNCRHLALNHPLLDLLGHDRAAGSLGDMHRAATDEGAAARAGAQFSQGHPHRHAVSLSLLALPPSMFRPEPREILLCHQVQNKRLSARPLTVIAAATSAFLAMRSVIAQLTCHDGTEVDRAINRPVHAPRK